ncbi:unnamed protein product, partial [Prorocentrum cordatum]
AISAQAAGSVLPLAVPRVPHHQRRRPGPGTRPPRAPRNDMRVRGATAAPASDEAGSPAAAREEGEAAPVGGPPFCILLALPLLAVPYLADLAAAPPGPVVEGPADGGGAAVVSLRGAGAATTAAAAGDDCLEAEGVLLSSSSSSWGQGPAGAAEGWRAARDQEGEWLQADLGVPRRVCGAYVQGLEDCWVARFSLQLSADALAWTPAPSGGAVAGPGGAAERSEVLLHPGAQEARYVRFTAEAWENHVCMRVGVMVQPAAAPEENARTKSPSARSCKHGKAGD